MSACVVSAPLGDAIERWHSSTERMRTRKWAAHNRFAGCSPAMRDRFLRRPQRPGARNAFTFGNRSADRPLVFRQSRPCGVLDLNLRKTAAEPAFTITGSVTFTLAVNALSRIQLRRATGIRGVAVRKL